MPDDRFAPLLRPFLPFAAPDEPLADDVKLRDLGLDSLGMVQLLGVLEETYQIRFLGDELTMGSFETPGILWKTVDSLTQRDAG